jgi:tRNA threonylcarbamoyladenosine biosynthesis protein TsaE
VTADARTHDIITTGEEETIAAGEALARTLAAGDVVLLHGQLGAGKTAFVRGIARGLGANADEVSSPTFTLIQEYSGGRCTLFHVDLYRLESAEVDDLGLEELTAGDGVVAIEWADRWQRPPDTAIDVTIQDNGDESRRIRIRTV